MSENQFQKCETCAFSCPLKMADGRSFGDKVYSSRCEKQYQLQHDKAIKSSFDYRQYLIENAEKLMNNDRTKAFNAFQR
jgi:hypothetical protein